MAASAQVPEEPRLDARLSRAGVVARLTSTSLCVSSERSRPALPVNTTASIRDATKIMTSKRFRHLPVMGDAGLAGIVDITDVCRALLEALSGPHADTAQPE